MSAYNDYMVWASVGFTNLAEIYCNQMQLGVPDKCLENRINVLAMVLDSIPRLYSGACVTDADVVAITGYINGLLGYPGAGVLSSDDIPVPIGVTVGGTTGGTGSTSSFAWNTSIGPTPTTITFDYPLGTTGSSWAMTYIAYDGDGNAVDITVTSRTNLGFVVTCDSIASFEGVATQI